MTRADGFSGIAPRRSVGITAGDGKQRVRLSAVVTAAGGNRLALALRVLPLQAAVIAPGAPVVIETPGGPTVDARVESLDAGGSPVLVVRALGQAEPAGNQRAFFRVAMRLMDTRAAVVAGGSAARFPVRLMDLSGGGARVLSPRPLVTGSTLGLRVPVFEGTDLEVAGRVTWAHSVRRAWQAGVAFTGLTESERDRIIRIVFRAELRERGKG